MPLIEAGFINNDGAPDSQKLITFGPTIEVIIGHIASDSGTPEQAQSVLALVDTGAFDCCIDSRIAESLSLPVVDVCEISGSGGTKTHPVYMAHIYIPLLERSQYGRFAGVDLIDGGQPHGALLGRTFLKNVIMIYDGLRAQVTVASAKV